jgi:hypothetical protein
MSHRLARAGAALAVPLAIALSAAPAQAGVRSSATSGTSVQSAARGEPSCNITVPVTTYDLASVTTLVTVDALCKELIMGVTVKVDGDAVVHAPILVLPGRPVHAVLVVPGLLRLGTNVCVQIDGAETCAKTHLDPASTATASPTR